MAGVCVLQCSMAGLYALQCSMLYSVLCSTVFYVLKCSMLYSVLCSTVFYALQCSMLYSVLCSTVFYALQCSMLYSVLCPTMFYGLQCSMAGSTCFWALKVSNVFPLDELLHLSLVLAKRYPLIGQKGGEEVGGDDAQNGGTRLLSRKKIICNRILSQCSSTTKKEKEKIWLAVPIFSRGGNFSRAEIKLVQRKSRLEASHKNNSSADRN